MGASLAGFFHLTGWPDRPPCGPFGAYSDYMSPRFALCALLAALDHRRRTGEGQYLDFAQAEAASHFLTPVLLDFSVNGHAATRNGNIDATMVPHGVYPSPGDDTWIAIACPGDAEWAALADAIGRPDLAGLTRDERRARESELDELVAAWTAGRPGPDVQDELIGRGVPAHVVQNSIECAVDPQLLHQEHFVALPHPEHGTVVCEASRTTLSATPAVVAGVPPLLGQDTVDVLTEVLQLRRRAPRRALRRRRPRLADADARQRDRAVIRLVFLLRRQPDLVARRVPRPLARRPRPAGRLAPDPPRHPALHPVPPARRSAERR